MTTDTPTARKRPFVSNPREDWLALRTEEVIEPDLPIVDAHHHLWERGSLRYMIQDLAADIASGHNVVATVYVDCHSMYRASGPAEFKPVGEVEFANGVAAMSASGGFGAAAICAGIVGHADLTLGDGARPVLEAEIAAGNGRFRGIRHLSSWDADADIAGPFVKHPSGLLRDEAFRRGFACLAPLGLSFDALMFHPQLGDLADLARAFPETPIVLNHTGAPVVVGRYADRRDEAYAEWKALILDLATCANVSVKLGGLAVGFSGCDFEELPMPPSSQDAADAWRPYLEPCIEAFGPERCMFESNFPVEKGQIGYQVLFNSFKRITAEYSSSEKAALYAGTAAQFYRLEI